MKPLDEALLKDIGHGFHKAVHKAADVVGGPIHQKVVSGARHARKSGVLPKGTNPFKKGSSHIEKSAKRDAAAKHTAAGSVLLSPADAIAGAAGALAGPAGAIGGIAATKAVKIGTAGTLIKSAERSGKASKYASNRLSRGAGYHEEKEFKTFKELVEELNARIQ